MNISRKTALLTAIASIKPALRISGLILCVLTLLSGCAAPRYSVLTGTEGVPQADLPLWPQGDTPRYRLSGIYYGEQNLKVIDEDEKKITLKKILYIIVGLFADSENLHQLQAPQGGVVDENGVLYVADVGAGSVFVFDQRPTTVGRLPVWKHADQDREFIAPIAMALGPMQQLLVTDAELGEVFRLDRQGNPLGSFGAGLLKRPTGIARDAARGEIYVADTQAHDIKVFSDQGQLLRTLGERGNGGGQLNFPIHLAFALDSLYVIDSMNTRVQRFDATGQHQLSFGSQGKVQGQFSRPKGIAVDSEGNIYVADSHFDYLLVYNPEGEFLLPIGGTGDQIGSFYLPTGVWVDDRDNIYIADMGNGRVLALQFLGGD